MSIKGKGRKDRDRNEVRMERERKEKLGIERGKGERMRWDNGRTKSSGERWKRSR